MLGPCSTPMLIDLLRTVIGEHVGDRASYLFCHRVASLSWARFSGYCLMTVGRGASAGRTSLASQADRVAAGAPPCAFAWTLKRIAHLATALRGAR